VHALHSGPLLAPWGWAPRLQVFQVAALNLSTFLCQHLKLGVCALPQKAVAAPSRSAFPFDHYSIYQQSSLGLRSARTLLPLARGMFRSCLGAQAAAATGLALAEKLSCMGHPLGAAADRKPSTVHYRPQHLQGNPAIQQLKALLRHFYISLSLILNVSTFLCSECAFCDHYFHPHIKHTCSRSLPAP